MENPVFPTKILQIIERQWKRKKKKAYKIFKLNLYTNSGKRNKKSFCIFLGKEITWTHLLKLSVWGEFNQGEGCWVFSPSLCELPIIQFVLHLPKGKILKWFYITVITLPEICLSKQNEIHKVSSNKNAYISNTMQLSSLKWLLKNLDVM